MADMMDFLGVITLFYWLSGLALVILSMGSSTVRAILSYGKHTRGWGASINPPPFVHALLIRGTVPNKIAWSSFYLVGLFLNTILIREYFNLRDFNLRALSAAIMFELHVLRRFLECIYVHKFAKRFMPLLHYAAAISFYFFTPLTPFLDALLFPRVAPSPSRVASASILFSAASLLQFLVHVRLADTKALGGRTKYGVPRGGLFEVVASPHYTAEICIYIALLIASNGAGIFSFLNWLCVFGNLSQTAVETNAWYRRSFHSSLLPPQRKALIPHVF